MVSEVTISPVVRIVGDSIYYPETRLVVSDFVSCTKSNGHPIGCDCSECRYLGTLKGVTDGL